MLGPGAVPLFLVYEGNAGTSNAFDLLPHATASAGSIFETVILMMTVLVLFFVPGLTAGAIAGERERQTLVPLQVTLLRPRSILFGKVAASLAFLLLLIVAALPVLAVSYLIGGIRLVDIGMGVLAVFIVALLVATMVVAVSSFAKRVQSATLIAYGFTALLSFIGPLVYGILMLLDNRSTGDENAAPAWIATVNPFALVADLGSGNRASGDGPLGARSGSCSPRSRRATTTAGGRGSRGGSASRTSTRPASPAVRSEPARPRGCCRPRRCR